MKKKELNVLVLDDSSDDVILLKRALETGVWSIHLLQVENVEQFKQALDSKMWDVVISDYVIPGFGGMEALQVFLQYDLEIPFILVSGKITEEMAVEALTSGAQDFVSKNNFSRLLPAIQRGIEKSAIIAEKRKAYDALVESEREVKILVERSPVAMLVCQKEVEACRVVIANNKFQDLFGYELNELSDLDHWWQLAFPKMTEREKNEEDWHAYLARLEKDQEAHGVETYITCKNGKVRFVRILLASVGQKMVITFEDFTERKEAEAKLRKSLIDTVKVMASVVEMRDPYTAGHQRRVSVLADKIAQRLGLSEERIEGIVLASQVHDIGKIKVPSEILVKPSHLTEIEFEIVKTHAEAGYQLLRTIDFPWPIATIIHQHHEKLDGSGYPIGLKGDEILLESQILTVADIVEAMASHRPYRPALGIKAAMDEILHERGVQLDPRVVDACFEVLEDGFEFSEGYND